MTAIRDHPERPSADQCLVLDRLALRMDWQTGCGYASVAQLAADTGCSEATVRRALTWARGNELLIRTRRGHRVTSERVVASEWRLTQPVTAEQLEAEPTQPVTAEQLEEPTAQNGRANRSEDATQPLTGDAPSRPSPSRPSSSANAGAARAAAPPRAYPQTPCRCGRPVDEQGRCAGCHRSVRVCECPAGASGNRHAPDYHPNSDHLISDHLISVTGTPELSDGNTRTEFAPPFSTSPYTNPYPRVAGVNGSVEVTPQRRGVVDNRDLGYAACHACGGWYSVMRGGAFRRHTNRGKRCGGSGTQARPAS
jgi:hypothetical protein